MAESAKVSTSASGPRKGRTTMKNEEETVVAPSARPTQWMPARITAAVV